ncbi:hypothetical protein LCGC14_0475380 [marine sediment metagenome]|uniref:Uncharacterized protein n=1 Tax=marine sediment metagenome TaxID=412755 RepID=A0A0F9SAY8_9ZZZZ
MFTLPAWITYQQFEVLKRIVPGHPEYQPLGMGMTQQAAADDMGVSLSTVKRIIVEIKDKFPPAWKRIKAMQAVMNRQLTKAHQMYSFDDWMSNISEKETVEKF